MLCWACKQSPVETEVRSDEWHNPFCVCLACAYRLNTFSLRPLEWYRLATLYGPTLYLLHDDFYDESGKAWSPEEEVVDAELFPAPILAQTAHDVQLLLDHAMTQWFITEDVFKAITQHDQAAVLRSLQHRVTERPSLETRSFAYEICARSVGRLAENWIRNEWKSFDFSLLYVLAEASAACLPGDEGFQLVVQAISGKVGAELARASGALSWFRSEVALNWIEENVCDPLVGDWGRLAAVSGLKWDQVAKWLTTGRPLSLVALDALNACWDYNTVILKRLSPKLLEPTVPAEMAKVLDVYYAGDSVHRVRQAILTIKSHWQEICEP
jgi:hypothetical protein